MLFIFIFNCFHPYLVELIMDDNEIIDVWPKSLITMKNQQHVKKKMYNQNNNSYANNMSREKLHNHGKSESIKHRENIFSRDSSIQSSSVRHSGSIGRHRSQSISRRSTRTSDKRRSEFGVGHHSRSIVRRRSRSIGRRRSRSIGGCRNRSICRRQIESINKCRSRSIGRRRSISIGRCPSGSSGRHRSQSIGKRPSQSIQFSDRLSSQSTHRYPSNSRNLHQKSSDEQSHPQSSRNSPTPKGKNERTVLCSNLVQNIQTRDIEDLFSSFGKVRSIQRPICLITNMFKDIAYIEFEETKSVELAIGLSGLMLLGNPIQVELSDSVMDEYTLYVSVLHNCIKMTSLKGIFKQFGHIKNMYLLTDSKTSNNNSCAFISYDNIEHANTAYKTFNGVYISGYQLTVTPKYNMNDEIASDVDTEINVPWETVTTIKVANEVTAPGTTKSLDILSIENQWFLVSNMFDANIDNVDHKTDWEDKIKDVIIEMCIGFGRILCIFLDKINNCVLVKCETVGAARESAATLNGLLYYGRSITAATYVNLSENT